MCRAKRAKASNCCKPRFSFAAVALASALSPMVPARLEQRLAPRAKLAAVLPANDQEREKMLRELHREVLDAIRDGKLDSVLDKRETPETLAAVKELDIEWINAASVHSAALSPCASESPTEASPSRAPGFTLRLARPGAAPYYAQVLTDAKGNAEMSVQVDEKSLADSSVLVQASFTTATRKFQLRAAKVFQRAWRGARQAMSRNKRPALRIPCL